MYWFGSIGRSGITANTDWSQLDALNDCYEGWQCLGTFRERATPVPIPNTAVKPFSADGSSLQRGAQE